MANQKTASFPPLPAAYESGVTLWWRCTKNQLQSLVLHFFALAPRIKNKTNDNFSRISTNGRGGRICNYPLLCRLDCLHTHSHSLTPLNVVVAACAMSYKPPMGDPDLLKRRIIANPRFDHVQPTVECGVTVTLAKMIRESEPSTKQGKDELFRRVRAATIANSLEEIHLAMKMKEYAQQDESSYARMPVGYGYDARGDGAVESRTPSSHAAAVAAQMEEFQIPKPPRREYLILDVRDREDYERCHILGAQHYPAAKLSHATNPYTPEILAFKNKENKVIVLYDLEEEIVVGRKVGNVFFEKGCDNVVIISGGLREFVQNFSHLIVGESPVPILPRNQRVLSRGGTSVANESIAEGSKMHSTATSHKPKSLSTSLARPQSNAWK